MHLNLKGAFIMFKFFKEPSKDKTNEKEEKTNSVKIESEQEPVVDNTTSQIPVVEMAPRDVSQLFRGSKKEFLENLEFSLSLLAKRLPDENLFFQEFMVGTRSKRKVAVVYLKDRANPGIVTEINNRIKAIRAETILDSSYLERNIENSHISPFPQVETTVRPDVAESALLQGRIVILVDESPEALLAPTTFFDLMDTPEDAYGRWYIASSFFRIARYIMFMLAVSLPAFYIALTSYNPELLPTKLAFLIAAYDENIPFPIYFEAFIMMGIVEAVRMIMIRMPSTMGSTIALFAGITLVGSGLYADIIGAPVTIIVTLTIICSFAIPNFDLRFAVRIMQFFTMLMTTFLGMFGFAVAFFFIAIHLVTLKSFGIPYMAPLAPMEASGWGHTILRRNTESMPQDETYKPLAKEGDTDGK